jgi:hypothetical protein
MRNFRGLSSSPNVTVGTDRATNGEIGILFGQHPKERETRVHVPGKAGVNSEISVTEKGMKLWSGVIYFKTGETVP